jgi:hypothetical protein
MKVLVVGATGGVGRCGCTSCNVTAL